MSTASEMLTRLIAKQNEAEEARSDLDSKRAAIVQLADDEGRSDLNPDEDSEFQELTASIRSLDEEIKARAERITELSESWNRRRLLTRSPAPNVAMSVTKTQLPTRAMPP